MAGAGADAKCPRRRGGDRSAPRIVPREKVVRRRVVARSWAAQFSTANRLEVLVEQGIAQKIAELGRLGGDRLHLGALPVFRGPYRGPVDGADGPRVGV